MHASCCRIFIKAPLLLLLVVAPLVAQAAARRRVVLLDADARLVREVEIALSPWGIDVAPSEQAGLGGAMPGVERRARDVARLHDAGAVVWSSTDGDGSALWIYDFDTEQVVARRLSTLPPFDDATAAAVALSVKTLLRTSTVAPPPERIGAAAQFEPPGAVGRLRVETSAGVRVLALNGARLEPRALFALSVWPARLERWLGFALSVAAGTGLSVDENQLSGRFSDVALGLALRTSRDAGRVSFEPSLGGALHITVLDGSVPSSGTPAHALRLDGAIEGGLAVGVWLGARVQLGVDVAVGYLLEHQRYLVAGVPVFEPSPLEVRLGLRMVAGIL